MRVLHRCGTEYGRGCQGAPARLPEKLSAACKTAEPLRVHTSTGSAHAFRYAAVNDHTCPVIDSARRT